MLLSKVNFVDGMRRAAFDLSSIYHNGGPGTTGGYGARAQKVRPVKVKEDEWQSRDHPKKAVARYSERAAKLMSHFVLMFCARARALTLLSRFGRPLSCLCVVARSCLFVPAVLSRTAHPLTVRTASALAA